MYINQAIEELSPFIEYPCVFSVIEKLQEISMNPKLLNLSEINHLIKKINSFKVETSIIKEDRSLAEVGLRVSCMLTILKPVDPEQDFNFSTESAFYKALQYLEKTKRSNIYSSSFFPNIQESTEKMDFESLAVDPSF